MPELAFDAGTAPADHPGREGRVVVRCQVEVVGQRNVDPGLAVVADTGEQKAAAAPVGDRQAQVRRVEHGDAADDEARTPGRGEIPVHVDRTCAHVPCAAVRRTSGQRRTLKVHGILSAIHVLGVAADVEFGEHELRVRDTHVAVGEIHSGGRAGHVHAGFGEPHVAIRAGEGTGCDPSRSFGQRVGGCPAGPPRRRRPGNAPPTILPTARPPPPVARRCRCCAALPASARHRHPRIPDPHLGIRRADATGIRRVRRHRQAAAGHIPRGRARQPRLLLTSCRHRDDP